MSQTGVSWSLGDADARSHPLPRQPGGPPRRLDGRPRPALCEDRGVGSKRSPPASGQPAFYPERREESSAMRTSCMTKSFFFWFIHDYIFRQMLVI